MSDEQGRGEPVVWVISTGTEILQGHYADRNAPWLSARLLELGLSTQRHMALPDKAGRLREGLAEAARAADLVITTGGLGPTGDDLNRQLIAEIWGVGLEENAEAWERILERFRQRGRPVIESNRVQAFIPAGAIALQNDNGTAPGFYLRPAGGDVRATIVALPGPPREMTLMFDKQAAPLVAEQFCEGRVKLRTLTFHTIGLAESLINEYVQDLFEQDEQVNFALLASLGKVDIRLTLMGPDKAANDALAVKWRGIVHERIGTEHIYGEDLVTLEEAVGGLLRERGQKVATAESCTGGMLAMRLTEMAGSSDFFQEGFVTYHNDAKMARLGVGEELLRWPGAPGAVSPEVAAAMASGARRAAGTAWVVSITGIAGPGGGSAEKPVGLVYLGLAGPDGKVVTVRHQFLGDRADIRLQSAQAALDMLRRGILGARLEGAVAFGTS